MRTRRGFSLVLALLAVPVVIIGRAFYRRRAAEMPVPEHPVDNVVTSVEGDFKTIFLLLVSLLHGSLFIFLCERTLRAIETFSWQQLSVELLFYAIFFRMLQTQILAALKYGGVWRVRPFDFILVFVTVLFEYIVFMHDSIQGVGTWFLRTVLIGFALFGIAGYIITYASIRKKLSPENLKRERIVQTVNVSVVLLIGALFVYDLNWQPFREFFMIANLAVALLLWINIYISIRLSKLTF